MSSEIQTSRRRLTVSGQVQGVGFRPFAYRLARELGLTGFIINNMAGVRVDIQGPPDALDEYQRRLRLELPPLAAIEHLETATVETMTGEKHFEILPSEGGQLIDAQVTVDTATCAQCIEEMNSPQDPRHAYPFINCTNCGPRYTIVGNIPYDRANTTMSEFGMCPMCASQYGDPTDRRFHAEPIACPVCGPHVWLVDADGQQLPCDNPIAEAGQMLREGKIVAIKGLGGFHLACRADDDAAVIRLRQRKHRDAKPFAMMVSDPDTAAAICDLNPSAASLLAGAIRPIVLAPPGRDAARISDRVSDGLGMMGIILPYTPLHHLLFARGAPGALVMTSGNFSNEPLIKDNDAAVEQLTGIADAILLHNRRIERSVDDSVAQITGGGRLQVLRRARGYVPRPIRLASVGEDSPAILAVGGELKNAICLMHRGRAVLSEHIGDLTDGRVYRHFIKTIDHLERLLAISPELLAVDLHPAYLSTQYARNRHRGDLPGRGELPIIGVQHHHAHIAACLAENDRCGPVIGLACDGTGYGDDGATWGCEVLEADLLDYTRLGHLRYLPLVGGDAAGVETIRPAIAALYDTFGDDFREYLAGSRSARDSKAIDAAAEMLALGVNCPPASSLGRWFDAVAYLTGVATANRYEGEAPMRLESVAAEGIEDGYAFEIRSTGPFTIDLRPMVADLCADLGAGTETPIISARFHNTVVSFLLTAAIRAREETALNTVAISGGCFANRYVTTRLTEALTAGNFEVLTHRRIPCNDGGIALGQAVIAEARHRRQAANSNERDKHNVSGSTNKD
ncbi:MAG: carbamoyltransferase HypF [Phycisphaerae bacterium]|jgi:hydrogenase maturation protein HypF|nr:carbamoyltransferase HypF [Phycisphaerae bacterium]